MTSPVFEIDLPLRDDWDTVEALRSTVAGCLHVLYQDRDFSETVGMILAELLENAVKYGGWGPGVAGRLRVSGRQLEVEIAVTNRLRDGDDASRLKQVITDLDAATSPAEAYAQRLRAAAIAPGPSGGLGLARISYEGNCRISVALNANGTVAVYARVAQFEATRAANA